MLADCLSEDTEVVVELGAWLGKSTRHILERAPRATVVSVDTWDTVQLAKWARERHPELLPVIEVVAETFMVNLWEQRGRVVPVRMDSRDALRAVSETGVVPDLVYVDASHRYRETLDELRLIASLFPAAQVVGDDWLWEYDPRSPERRDFPVQRAVRAFLAGEPLRTVATDRNGWRLEDR